MNHVRLARILYALTSALLMLTGVALLVWPGFPAEVLCRTVGAIVLVCGAVKLYGYFVQDLYRLAFQYDLALGGLTLLLGAAMLLLPQQMAGAVFTVLAGYVLINAMFTVQTAVEAQRFGLDKWWLVLAGGGIAGLLALLLLTRPTGMHPPVVRLTGLALLADGMQNLLVAALTICVRAAEKDAVPRRRALVRLGRNSDGR